jgi:large subunit ribosomal protein L9
VTPVKLVLRADVANLGRKGDVVEVAAGFARNFLVPRGLAIAATPGGEAQAEGMRRTRMLKEAKDREAAQEVAKVLVPATIRLVARAGDGGRLFGSVTAADIVAAVAAQTPVVLDRRSVTIADPIKSTGTHTANVRLPGDVEFPIAIEVVSS